MLPVEVIFGLQILINNLRSPFFAPLYKGESHCQAQCSKEYYKSVGYDLSCYVLVIQTIPRTEASAVANPRKLKKPTMSVTVVNIMDEDEAGS